MTRAELDRAVRERRVVLDFVRAGIAYLTVDNGRSCSLERVPEEWVERLRKGTVVARG